MGGFLAAMVVAAFATAAASPKTPPPVAVEFAAADGLLLHGSYWAAAEPGPAVLLLHQCNMDRASWAPLAAALADAGLHVLAFDFRGFGQSRNERTGEFSANRKLLWPEFVSDVDRAVAFLGTLPDVDMKRFGVMGASCGGSQTLLLALRDPSVKAIGFLSSSLPFLTDQDLVQFEKNRDLPILAIAAEKDEGTYERTKRLFESSPNPASKLLLYKGDLHGVPLFAHDPGLVDSIVAWFRARL
jgi:dienelactone hydrolase